MKHLRKKLKSYINTLRNAYRSSSRNSNEWLRDNFHIFEKNFISAMKESTQFSLCVKTSCVSDVCSEIVSNGILPQESRIIQILLKKPLSTIETEHLAFFIKYELLKTAAESVNSDEEIFENTVRSLFKIEDTDFGNILYETCETEKLLCQDPSGIYRNMDEATKSKYRKAVCKMAQNNGKNEIETAVDILEKAEKEKKHIGFFIDFGTKSKSMGIFMIALEAVIPLVVGICISVIFKAWYLFPLTYLPLWECTKFISSIILSGLSDTENLMSMNFTNSIPDSEKTVIAVSAILPTAQKADEITEHLKQLYLSNCPSNCCICFLADLRASKTPTTAEDRTDIKAMKRVITQLNEKYGNRFILAVRNRRFSITENEYTGHERKRGAITELVKLIKTGDNGFKVLHGDADKLIGAKYIMALDSDTEMPAGSLIKLISVAAHPLNTPVISMAKQRITAGYGIIAPRTETGIKQAGKTYFSSLMTGSAGLPAYSSASSEKYQQLFGQSIFCGKGLINVDAFAHLLSDRLPEQQILSHDILEGIILRTGFAGNTALTDSFPTNTKSYFKRQHRWIRGDVQNLSLLTDKRYSSHITALGKWWLIDNIRRSVTPVIAFISIILSFIMPAKTAVVTVAVALLSSFMPDFVSFVSTVIHGGISMISRLYFSDTVPYALNCLLRGFVRLTSLAREAASSSDAVFRAFYRLTVSRKHLLEWTTAADSDKSKKSQFSVFSLISGLLLIIFGVGLQRAAGCLFLLDIPISYFTAKTKKVHTPKITDSEKEQLLSYCSSMWRFYEDLCTKENNYLIPDNVQDTPVSAVAKRTSPTNIGLMLCAFLAARDLNFISTPELHRMLSNSLDSIEKLPKYKGNLYNWYSTEDLTILSPQFVSAVDSGNFLCCLTALKEGLREYIKEYHPLSKTIQRISVLIDTCDFGFLYSNRRNLFYIGFDAETEKFTDSYFDLLMSEARMASYYAVAKGCVPLKHWETLGRTLSKCGRYTGAVSWSGTMFEYLMPAVFLPGIHGTLSSEATKFCIHAQKKRVKNMNIPYGISESGYYAFDAQLNYQYKAHGIKNLSLKNSPDDETVISPYSTFLTLPEDPHSAMNNLKRLEKLGAKGRYGFCEALDFSPYRTDGRQFCIVRSYMAHHIGMSFLAADNCIFGNIMQRRFMSDDSMAGKMSLLEEKVPTDIKIRKNISDKEIHIRPDRIQKTKQNYNGITAFNTNCTVLSNGEWSVFAADTGVSVSVYDNMSVFKCRKDAFTCPDGIFSAVRYNGDNILAFTDAPEYKQNSNLSASFTETGIVYKNSDKSFSVSQTVTVHPSKPCEIRSFRIKNKTKSKKSISLLIYTEPSIENINENIAHPAFSNMFLSVEYLESEKVIVFTRKTESKENRIYIAMGFTDYSDFILSTDREKILSKNKGIFEVFKNDFNSDSTSLDKCIALQSDFNIPSYASVIKTLAVCASQSREEAVNSILTLRKSKAPQMSKCGKTLFSPSSVQDIYAKKIIGRYMFSQSLPSEAVSASKINNGSRNDLWSLGLSGDYPIILVRVSKDDITVVNSFSILFDKLKNAGLTTELVFISSDSFGYENRVKDCVLKTVKDKNILNRRGGIFIIGTDSIKRNELSALTSAAVTVYPESGTDIDEQKFVLTEIKNSQNMSDKNLFIKGGYMIGKTPELPWCHIIANRNFGTLLSDSSLGYTWALNSRENKLTPWHNDTRRTFNGEMLIMDTDNGRFDIIKGSSAFFKNGSGEYYATADGLNIRTSVTVPGEIMLKQTEINIINESASDREILISYYTEPVMGDFITKPLFIKKETDANTVTIKNTYNSSFDGYMIISSDGECNFSFDKASFLANKASDRDVNDCVIITRKIYLPSKSDTTIRFRLSYGKTLYSAEKMPYIIPEDKNKNRIIIDTPDEQLNRLFNDFLPNQIISGRIFARTGFYQCSGAYGFRDQLQDAMAVRITHPQILKNQILKCAAAQFSEGDVLHWFHQLYSSGRRILRGVRTTYSDDLLWLPLAVCEYCETTGDMKILDMPVPFLEAPILEKGEKERFGEFTKGKTQGNVYEHCIKAITHSCKFGCHGLPLIKGGDWNDSFNAVGIDGKGESVWLAMFMSYVFNRFSAVCNAKNDTETANVLKKLAQKLLVATDDCAWDNDRYLRCFYDDGSPMGKNGNSECAIDLLPQAWSVISEMPDRKRCETAVDAAYNHLVDKENGIVKLFTPPFGEKSKTAGYVNRYPAGIRENGGQYTHGAIWLAEAFFRLGNADKGYELLNIMNPAKKTTEKYKTEPYYLAGDVYSAKNMEGRGGWSIYTGSAGWYYRTVAEQMLGIKMTDGSIKINPCLPKEFGGSRVKIILNGETHNFELRR